MNEPPIPARLTDDAPEWWDGLPDRDDDLDDAIVVERLISAVEANGELRYLLVDRRHAEWAMRKLATVEARVRESRLLAAQWRDKIDEWERDELARVAKPAAFFDALLRDFGLRTRMENPKEATIRLPSGVIKTQVAKTPKVTVTNEDVLIAWLMEHATTTRYEEIVQQTPKVLSTGLRAAVVVQLELRPWCQTCGEALLIEDRSDGVVAEGDKPALVSSVTHATDGTYDHDPMPGAEYVARLDGEELPGVSAELADTSASVVVK